MLKLLQMSTILDLLLVSLSLYNANVPRVFRKTLGLAKQFVLRRVA